MSWFELKCLFSNSINSKTEKLFGSQGPVSHSEQRSRFLHSQHTETSNVSNCINFHRFMFDCYVSRRPICCNFGVSMSSKASANETKWYKGVTTVWCVCVVFGIVLVLRKRFIALSVESNRMDDTPTHSVPAILPWFVSHALLLSLLLLTELL